MSETPRKAEHLLADEGVFAGHTGLRRLAENGEFWDKQMYGTRLYFGPGGSDYLHRSVLQSAIDVLDKLAVQSEGYPGIAHDFEKAKAELAAKTAENEALREALIKVRDTPVDGRGLDYYWIGREVAEKALAAIDAAREEPK